MNRFFTTSLVTLSRWLRSKKVILLVLLILVIGSVIRIYDLGTESLWLDEAISVKFSAGNVSSIITESGWGRASPPLYWVMLHYWMSWFGDGEAAVRSLSVVFAVGAILLTYLVGRELFSRKVGLIASLLSTVSCFHLFYAQEARPYSLLLFLSLLSYFFLIKILKQNKNWHYLAYFLASFLLGYTHVFGLFIIASQIFYFCLRWSKYQPQRKSLIITLIATIVSLSPLILMLGSRTAHIATEGFWVPEPSFFYLGEIFADYAGYNGGQIALLLIFSILGLIGLFSIFGVKGKWLAKRPLESLKGLTWRIKRETFEEILLLVLWLSFPIVIPFIISKITTPILILRYTIGASPAFYLLVARGMDIFKWKRVLPVTLVVIIIIISSFGLYSYYKESVKPEWREAASFIENNSIEGDAIIFYPLFRRIPFDYYYQGNLPILGKGQEASAQELIDFIDSAAYANDRLWLIVQYTDERRQILGYLRDNYGPAIILEQDFYKVSVFLIDLPQEESE